jgi:hypothetical protein
MSGTGKSDTSDTTSGHPTLACLQRATIGGGLAKYSDPGPRDSPMPRPRFTLRVSLCAERSRMTLLAAMTYRATYSCSRSASFVFRSFA